MKEISSFRDPDGFVFHRNGKVHRQIQKSYQKDYDFLMESGLYQALIDKKFLIPHEEVNELLEDQNAYKIIRPQQIPFISYPFEWSFSQLKAAAFLTLDIQKLALEYGMTLKDATAYNIQFIGVSPVFIDTLSFTQNEGGPWVAYKQFCQHFITPLALMTYCGQNVQYLFKHYMDGIPLDFAAQTLPFKAKLKLGLFFHIVLHNRSQKKHQANLLEQAPKTDKTQVNLFPLLQSLEQTLLGLRWKEADTEWKNYYSATNYTESAFEAKKQLVSEFISRTTHPFLVDLGANTGVFSQLAVQQNRRTLSVDIDYAAVELHYRHLRKTSSSFEEEALPLVLDLANPNPAYGWAGEERRAWTARVGNCVGMALAIIHHIAIGNNVPLPKIASFFATFCDELILEFVPKEDSQVKRLLQARKDIFPEYKIEGFKKAFVEHFNIVQETPIEGTVRTLFLFKRK